MRKAVGLRRCPILLGAEDVARAFADMARLEREVLLCAALDCKCRLVHWGLLSVGSSDRVTLRLGDAFHGAIRQNARGIILVHNHPSGSLRVSKEDKALTQRAADAGELLGYTLLDHVILSRYGYRSVMRTHHRVPWSLALHPGHAERLDAAERRSPVRRRAAGG
jgi:DNA repair protein RadC